MLRLMLQQHIITRVRVPARRARPAAEAGDVHLPGVRARRRTSRVREAAADRARTGATRLRRRLPRAHDDQPAAAAARARGDRQVAAEPDGPQAALVAINPQNGAVLAMSAAGTSTQSQFNLAVHGERQPGSAFKPFVLATALEAGHLAADHVRVEADRDLPRRQVLVRAQLRGRRTSARSTCAGDRSVPTTPSSRS